MSQGIFVTGTDTGVGKTVVSGCLARYLQERKMSVVTQKWVQAGAGEGPGSDIGRHLKIMGHILPYSFRTACSPHLASEIEGKRISAEKIKQSFRFLSQRFEFVIVEGTGGALVPFNRKRLLIDIARELGLAALVVAQNKLGGINHTLLTLEALKARRIKILGVVFNNVAAEKKIILRDNPRIVRKLSAEALLGILPRNNNMGKLYRSFVPIGKKIWKKIA